MTAPVAVNPLADSLVNNTGSLEMVSNNKFTSLLEMGSNLIDNINISHQFLQQVMSSTHIPNANELRKIQDTVEELTISSQLLSKTV